MNIKSLICGLTFGLAVAAFGAGQGDGTITVDSTISDHCVFLQNANNVVKGTAKAGCTVTVTFGGTSYTGTADASGNYRVTFNPGAANATGRDLTVSDGVATKTISDVLVGEVWYVSGQSNVAIPMSHSEYVGKVDEWMQDINYPLIRMAVAPNNPADPIIWQVIEPSNSENVIELPPLPLFFAKDMYKHKNVPVGITVAAVGATAIGQWLSDNAIAAAKAECEACKNYGYYHANGKDYDATRASRFDSVVARAAIWCQGEADAMYGACDSYAAHLRALINDWRTRRNDPDFPVVVPNPALCVTYNDWTLLSCKQQEVSETMSNVVCVPQTDLGYNTAEGAYAVRQHPDDKDKLSVRLYAAARNLVYGESNVPYRCPYPTHATYEGGKTVIVHFPEGTQLQRKDVTMGYPDKDPYRVVTVKGTKMQLPESSVVIGADGRSLVYTMSWEAEPAQVEYLRNQNTGAFDVKLYDQNDFPMGAFSIPVGSGEPHTHVYATTNYVWTGYTACVAKKSCSCGSVVSENGTITSVVTKDPTETETGVRTYTATFATMGTATKTETIPATGGGTSGEDDPPTPPPSGEGLSPSGSDDVGAIQAAIDAAGAGGTVTLGAGTFLINTQLMIGNGVTLIGQGRDKTTLKYNGAADQTDSRVATISDGAVLSSVTVTGGKVNTGHGGGLLVSGSGTVTGCAVTGNYAQRGFGGGIRVNGSSAAGNVRIDHTIISGNTAGMWSANSAGGGIYVFVDSNSKLGRLEIDTCLITGNTVGTASYARNGGGVAIEGYDQTVFIRNTTIVGNTASGVGGGLYLNGCVAKNSVTLTNDIFAGNTAGSAEGNVAVSNALISDRTVTAGCLFGLESEKFGTGSVSGDPRLSDDFRPTSDSTLVVGKGTAYEGIGTDLDGNLFADPPSIGCYELGGTPPEPQPQADGASVLLY